MTNRRKRQKQGSLMGAIFIETLAVVGIISLFFTMQDKRAEAISVDELIKPQTIVVENQPGGFPAFNLPQLERAPSHQSTGIYQSSRRNAAATEIAYSAPVVQWRESAYYQQ